MLLLSMRFLVTAPMALLLLLLLLNNNTMRWTTDAAVITLGHDAESVIKTMPSQSPPMQKLPQLQRRMQTSSSPSSQPNQDLSEILWSQQTLQRRRRPATTKRHYEKDKDTATKGNAVTDSIDKADHAAADEDDNHPDVHAIVKKVQGIRVNEASADDRDEMSNQEDSWNDVTTTASRARFQWQQQYQLPTPSSSSSSLDKTNRVRNLPRSLRQQFNPTLSTTNHDDNNSTLLPCVALAAHMDRYTNEPYDCIYDPDFNVDSRHTNGRGHVSTRRTRLSQLSRRSQ